MVVIERDSTDLSYRGRVYVTGPHFGRSVYSSKHDISEGTMYERTRAEQLLAEGKWHSCNPLLVEVDE